MGLLDALIGVGRAVVDAGLVQASGGNLSARVPGSDTFWVTAAGTWFDRLVRTDFVECPVSPRDGPAASARRPSTEVALHAATYRVRPDVNAVVHLHPQYAVLLDALGERIRLITTDHAVYVGRVATTSFHPPGTTALADAAAAAVADGTNCVLLAQHGCSVLGETVEQALRRALNLEEAARLTYRALLLTGGIGPRPIVECPADLGTYLDRA